MPRPAAPRLLPIRGSTTPRSVRVLVDHALAGSALALVAASLLVSCAEQKPPVVELNSPPTSIEELGGRLAVENNAATARTAPDACDLLKDATVESVLPQAKKVSHTASDVGLVRPSTDDKTTTVPGTRCTFTIDLPVGALAKDAGTVEVVFGPHDSLPQDDVFAAGLDDDLLDGSSAASLRPGTCSNASSGAVQCLSSDGQFTFWVKTSLPRHTRTKDSAKDSPEDHYRSSGLTEKFRAHDKEADRERHVYLGQRISRPLGLTILTRLDGRTRYSQ